MLVFWRKRLFSDGCHFGLVVLIIHIHLCGWIKSEQFPYFCHHQGLLDSGQALPRAIGFGSAKVSLPLLCTNMSVVIELWNRCLSNGYYSMAVKQCFNVTISSRCANNLNLLVVGFSEKKQRCSQRPCNGTTSTLASCVRAICCFQRPILIGNPSEKSWAISCFWKIRTGLTAAESQK